MYSHRAGERTFNGAERHYVEGGWNSLWVKGELADQAQEVRTARRAKPVSYQLQQYANSSVRNDPFFTGQQQQSAITALIGELDAMLSAFNKGADHSPCGREK
jgi:hypothetical protein